MPKAKTPKEKKYITLKVELDGTDIKRTIIIPSDTLLVDFDCAVQDIFGWNGSHLWAIEVNRNLRYAEPSDFDDDFAGFGVETRDALKYDVGDLLRKTGDKFLYLYDSGDGWEHKVTRMEDPKTPGTRVTKTSGLMGIDDIGGAWRLSRFIEFLKEYDANPKMKVEDKELRETLPWSGLEDDEARKEYLTPPTVEELTDMLREVLGD